MRVRSFRIVVENLVVGVNGSHDEATLIEQRAAVTVVTLHGQLVGEPGYESQIAGTGSEEYTGRSVVNRLARNRQFALKYVTCGLVLELLGQLELT